MSNGNDDWGGDDNDWAPDPNAGTDEPAFGQPAQPGEFDDAPAGQPGAAQPGGIPQPGAAPQQPGQPGPMQSTPGTNMKPAKPKLENEDIIAIILSAFLPGVGHMMLGQTTKGIVILLVNLVTCWGLGLLWIAVTIDAYLVAMARKVRTLDDWEFFPDYKNFL